MNPGLAFAFVIGSVQPEPNEEPGESATATEQTDASADVEASPELQRPEGEADTTVAPTDGLTPDQVTEPESEPEPQPQPQPQSEPEPQMRREPVSSELESDADDLSGDESVAGTSTTVNGLPCDDPRVGTPRLLLTLDGHHPCEEARHDTSGGVRFYPGFQFRTQVGYLSPLTLDRDGTDLDENFGVSGRIRWEPRLEWPGDGRISGRIKLSVDVVNGLWAPLPKDGPGGQILREGNPPVYPMRTGQPYPPMVENINIVDPRELYLELTFAKAGLLRIGQQSFSWGLGLIANDGNNMDRFGDLKFGSDGLGGIYERVLFATRPFSPLGGKARDIVTAVGGDLVYRDENASLVHGDLAGQAILVIRYQPDAKPGNWIGGYAAFRSQKSADDGDAFPYDNLLQVGVADVAGQGQLRLDNGLTVLGGFETVFVAGRTQFFAEAPGDEKIVLQGGAALRGYIGDPKTWLVGFDGGYASGDSDPNDDLFTSFRGRTGYSVGLLMFPYVFGWQSAQSQVLIESDELMMVNPQGSQYVDTKGSVTNAIHLQPKARWALNEMFEVWGGPLVAVAPNELFDPYASNVGGGTNRNALGGPGSNRYLGTEVDLGLRIRHAVNGLWLQTGLQGGALFPGGALSDENGEHDTAIWGVWWRTELRY